MSSGTAQAQVHAIERPHPNLLAYYAVESLVLGPLFFAWLLPRFFRYRTLRYRFDAEGVSMRWGILFRREIHLTYRRIQDIHLTSNVVERWLGLARIQVQTASGSARAEMTIEGVQEYEAVRDLLYARMRGVAEEDDGDPAGTAAAAAGGGDELAAVLGEVAAELRRLRLELADRERPRRGPLEP